MFSARSTTVYLAREPADMRKGHDGLFALVRQLDLDPFTGHLFVFLNRRRNRVKVLFMTRGGFSLLYKRLEKSAFFLPPFPEDSDRVKLSRSELSLLLEGLDPFRAPSIQAWEPPAA
jgi:transposase